MTDVSDYVKSKGEALRERARDEAVDQKLSQGVALAALCEYFEGAIELIDKRLVKLEAAFSAGATPAAPSQTGGTKPPKAKEIAALRIKHQITTYQSGGTSGSKDKYQQGVDKGNEARLPKAIILSDDDLVPQDQPSNQAQQAATTRSKL